MIVLDGIRVEATDGYVLAALPQSRQALSCAVHGGGPGLVRGVLNLKVPANFDGKETDHARPGETLARAGAELGLGPDFIGLMTAADMGCFRLAELRRDRLGVAVLVTAGLSNARRAGDPADWTEPALLPRAVGTINTVVFTSAPLTPAALVEAVVVATEAKTAALYDLGAISRLTGLPATGTGTDAVAVVAGVSGESVPFCGKHTLLGELMGRGVMRALRSSLEHDHGVGP